MLLIQDGATPGHTGWAVDAIRRRAADGLIVSPFFTPASSRPRHKDAATVSLEIADAGGRVILDPTTHAVRLPAVDYWDLYDTWNLWPGARGDLDSATAIRGHVTRCLDSAYKISATPVAPTLALDNPAGPQATVALALADEARAQFPETWQALAGRRTFWLSPELDAYVGSLAALDAPAWVITVVRDNPEWPPKLHETSIMEAVLRSVHSLSLRSRVVFAHSDLIGLPAIAAGADTIGTGWHTKQRVAAPATYQRNDPTQIRRQAKWFTFEGLCALIHEQQATVLAQSDRTRAERLYTGPLVDATGPRRVHHLDAVRRLALAIHSVGPDRRARVQLLRTVYEQAQGELDALRLTFGRAFEQQRVAYVDGCYEGLRAYAQAENYW